MCINESLEYAAFTISTQEISIVSCFILYILYYVSHQTAIRKQKATFDLVLFICSFWSCFATSHNLSECAPPFNLCIALWDIDVHTAVLKSVHRLTFSLTSGSRDVGFRSLWSWLKYLSNYRIGVKFCSLAFPRGWIAVTSRPASPWDWHLGF